MCESHGNLIMYIKYAQYKSIARSTLFDIGHKRILFFWTFFVHLDY